jgi:hypothetical protein
MKKFLVLLVVLSFAFAQNIDISRSSSKLGGYISEIGYSVNYKNQSLVAKSREESLGNSYYVNYNAEFELADGADWFTFATYKNDNIVNTESLDLGIGYGMYVYDEDGASEKVSIAGMIRGTQYITSLRSKLKLVSQKHTLKMVTFYLPEVGEWTNDFKILFQIDDNKAVGYKHFFILSNGVSNYYDSIFAKFTF